jgi:hypothetical protein
MTIILIAYASNKKAFSLPVFFSRCKFFINKKRKLKKKEILFLNHWVEIEIKKLLISKKKRKISFFFYVKDYLIYLKKKI